MALEMNPAAGGETLSTFTDASGYHVERVQNVGEMLLDIARGKFTERKVVHKFGANEGIPNGTLRDVWAYGSTGLGNIDYPWPDTTETVNLVSSDANDDGTPTSNTGAQKVTVEGLDGSWDEVSEEITLNGTSAVTTTQTFRRVFRAYVSSVGTYGGTNIGAITITHTTSGDVVAYIAAGVGQTQMTHYTVPNGYTAYMYNIDYSVAVGTNKDADIRMWQRPNADDITQPYDGAKRIVHAWLAVQQASSTMYQAYPSFAAKTDLWAQAAGNGAATEVEFSYCLVLIKEALGLTPA